MFRLGATIRLVIGLVCLALSGLLAARTFGLAPDELAVTVKSRASLAETIALHCSTIVAMDLTQHLDSSLEMVLRRNPDILSSGVRRRDGSLIAVVGDHEEFWGKKDKGQPDSQIYVPIIDGKSPWGELELRFKNGEPGWFGWLRSVRDLVFVAIFSSLAYFLYLRKMLSHLDPSRVIPERVRTAFDTLAQGLLVLDEQEQIVLANRSFSAALHIPASRLQGKSVNELPWAESDNFPWQQALKRGEVEAGAELQMLATDDEVLTYRVNAAPIKTEDNAHRGVLVSFDDITLLEKRKQELKSALSVLQDSREKIRLQNEELMVLATQDPLTGCLNRRSFFERVETLWHQSKRYDQEMSCILLDIDHFKSVNDNHGHSTGDEVLRSVSSIIRAQLRDADVFSRYGGEEFCVVLPQLDIAQAEVCAERLRASVEAATCGGLNVTASFGVSALHDSVVDIQQLLDEADKSLYVAKRGGRNRVVRWDQTDAESLPDEDQSEPSPVVVPTEEVEIPFHAVIGLISALGYRDGETASHSRRVADLCAELAQEKLSVRDCYVLEIAALLHDIGKIGIPDSVLLKPGPLTEDERKIMRLHDAVSVDIITSTFTCKELAEIVKLQHAWYGDNSRDPTLPLGKDIPYGARILAIADAYDAMTSQRVYAEPLSQEQAFNELHRCAGTQFDPDLVPDFIEVIKARSDRKVPLRPVTKQTAVRIGLYAERLTDALSRENAEHLIALARQLNETAIQANLDEIAQQSASLEQAASNEDSEAKALIQVTSDLLDLCRMTQRAYFENTHGSLRDSSHNGG